ncbi:DUF4369 domain-containing protein, partial [Geofilum rubicundum]|uniref:DUF4369 domain-containing protein n=1 Tax=Geofilum rubicundum TaxID=472113 RepID=UPI0012FB6688
MKKLFLGLALMGFLAACSTDTYKVSGNFEDITTGTVYLKKIEAQGVTELDTATIEDGSFVFEGSVEHPELHLIFFEENRTPI